MAELYKSVTELMKTARGNKALQDNLGDITDFQQIIDDTPTADVVEVKHGEWISKIFKVTGRKFITCSVCNSPIDSTYTHIDENEFDYCPYCGAKMDGGKAE